MKSMTKKSIEDYQTIILDMDGTLYFQLPLRVCMAFSLGIYYLIHFYRMKELFLIKKFRQLREAGHLAEADNLASGKMKQRLEFWIYEYPLRFVCLFRDKKLVAKMNGLKRQGTKIIVYSDYDPKDKIKAVGLEVDGYFYPGDSIVKCLKPDSSGLESILRHIGEKASDALFIGDRYEKDGLCAMGVQMDYIILNRKHPVLTGAMVAITLWFSCGIILQVSYFSYSEMRNRIVYVLSAVIIATILVSLAMYLIIKGGLLSKIFAGVKGIQFAITLLISTILIVEWGYCGLEITNIIALGLAAVLFAIALTAVIGIVKYLASKETAESGETNLKGYRFLGYALFAAMVLLLLVRTTSLALEWDDVEWTLNEIIGRDFKGINSQLIRNGFNMPLYYWVLALFYNFLPHGKAIVFLPSMIATVAGIVLLSNVAKKLGGDKLKYITLSVASISVALIVQGGWRVRPYGFVFCFATLSLYMYINRLKEESWRNIICYGLAMMLLLYSHWFGAIVVFFYALCDLYLYFKKAVHLRSTTSYFLAGGTFLVWFGLVVTNLTHSEINTWATRKPVLLSPVWSVVYITGGCVLAIVPFLLVVLISKKRLTKNTKENIANKSFIWIQCFLSIMWTLIIVFCVSNMTTDKSFYLDRYFFIVLPQAILLTAYGIVQILKRAEGFQETSTGKSALRTFVKVMVIVAIVNFSYSWIFASEAQGTYKGAGEFLAKEANIHNADTLVIGRREIGRAHV